MMKIIVAQKQMNLLRLIVFALSAIVLALSGNLLGAEVAQTQPGNSRRTFADWCRQKASLSPETKHTIEMLSKQPGATDC